MFHTDDARAAETARLNDIARTNPQRVNAAWFTTRGVAALVGDDPGKRRAQVEAVASFADFSEDNDPYGERDLGAFTFWGERLLWKIDYYHPERDEHSPIKWSAELTRRVLTLMLASEY